MHQYRNTVRQSTLNEDDAILDDTDTLNSSQPERKRVRWSHKLATYRTPDNKRAIFELAVTLIPFIVCWIGIVWLMKVNVFLGLVGIIPGAGLLLRLFILQHDCGHGALFSSARANDWVGRFLGLVTFTPYDYWRQAHAVHHATSGNLDRREIGEIGTLTVAEYNALSPFRRLGYRLFRHPLTLFLIGPVWLFLIQQRLPIGGVNRGWMPWYSLIGTNLGIAVIATLMIYFLGWQSFVMIALPMIVLAGSVGIWLFYVQHQFEGAYWADKDEWTHEHAALHGSSYLDLPWPLPWFSGNIGIHHVHHISSRIPFYRLPTILKDHPELRNIGHMTLWQSFKCARLKLWDEGTRRLVSFRQARQIAA